MVYDQVSQPQKRLVYYQGHFIKLMDYVIYIYSMFFTYFFDLTCFS